MYFKWVKFFRVHIVSKTGHNKFWFESLLWHLLNCNPKTEICFIWQFCGQNNDFALVYPLQNLFRGPQGPKKVHKINKKNSGWLWQTFEDFWWLCLTLADSGWLWLTLADSGWVRVTLTDPANSGGLWLTEADSCQLWQGGPFRFLGGNTGAKLLLWL